MMPQDHLHLCRVYFCGMDPFHGPAFGTIDNSKVDCRFVHLTLYTHQYSVVT